MAPGRASKSSEGQRSRPATRSKTKTQRIPKFGRPGTGGKAEGDAAVRAWMGGLKPHHRVIVQKLDALIGEDVLEVKRAVKWSMLMYGVPGRGWIAHVASYTNYVALGFFAGASLNPPPPEGEGKGMRRVNIHNMDEYEEERFRSWIREAATKKGWGNV